MKTYEIHAVDRAGTPWVAEASTHVAALLASLDTRRANTPGCVFYIVDPDNPERGGCTEDELRETLTDASMIADEVVSDDAWFVTEWAHNALTRARERCGNLTVDQFRAAIEELLR